MATKRMLYVNSANINVGQKKNRRPLVQGRLVSATELPADAPRLQQGTIQDAPFQHLSATIDDLNVTPRRTIPLATEHQSPRPSPRAEKLDLSDVEEGFVHQVEQSWHSPHLQTEVQHVPHVIVLDASAAYLSADQVEVECVVGYERTPAQVICHSQPPFSKQNPSHISGDERLSHWNVQTGQVLRVCSIPGSITAQHVVSPDAGSDRTVPASGKSHQEKPEEIDTLVSRFGRQDQAGCSRTAHPPHLQQPLFDDSLESEKVSLGQVGKSGQGKSSISEDAGSDSEACSLFEYVPQGENRSKVSGDHEKGFHGSGKKKKGGERIVPSRYLQSAESKKKPYSAGLEKKVPQRPLSSTGGNYVAKATSLPGKSKRSRSQQQQQHRQRSSSSPLGADRKNSKEKTSTPTHTEAAIVLNSCDYSAISVDLSSISMADASMLRGQVGGFQPSSQPVSHLHRGKDLSVLQQICDQEYAHYLQTHYLSSLGQKNQRDVQKEAMKQLTQLWNLMDMKQQEAAELEKEVLRLQHLNRVQDMLQAQQGGLLAAAQMLPAQQREHTVLSTALDTTRHQLETHGILIPPSEEQYEAELADLLLETEDLLRNIVFMCKDTSSIQTVATIFQEIQRTAEAQRSDVLKCVELVSAMESLVTQETSLRIQDMQARA